MYAVRGSDQAGQAYRDLVRVRKKTVRAYLRFFARHHAIYKAGIRNFNSSSSDPQAADYYLVRPFTEADIDMAMVNNLPDDGVPDEDWAEKAFGDTSFAMRKVELKENEACGADEEMPHQAANDGDSDSGDDGDSCGEGDDSSGEGDDDEQPPLRRSSQGPLSERPEQRHRPVPEEVFCEWLLHSHGAVALCLRAKLVRLELPIGSTDRTVRQGVAEQVLRQLHGISDDRTPRSTSELTISLLAGKLKELFAVGDKEGNVVHLCTELAATARSMRLRFQESGLPHTTSDVETGDPIADLANDLEALLSGQFGTESQPNELPPRGAAPLSEHRTKGYVTLAFPTLFPFGLGDFLGTRKHELSWIQWSRHLQNYYDGRFAKHRRFPYFMLNTHEREVANRQAGLYVLEQEKRMTVGQLRGLSKSERNEIARKVCKYGATLRNTPAFMGERRSAWRPFESHSLPPDPTHSHQIPLTPT